MQLDLWKGLLHAHIHFYEFQTIVLKHVVYLKCYIKPDPLVDSCKHLSINCMAAGLRLPRSSHGIFSLFKHSLSNFVLNRL